jgi:HK97 family phage major capsid protein
MALHELKQKRNTIAADMRALHEKIGDTAWTDEQRTQWGAMKSELDALDAQIAREEELRRQDQTYIEDQEGEQRQQQGNHGDPQQQASERRAAAFNGFLRRGVAELSAEERQALRELRAQGTSPDEQGGYTVPTQFQNRIVESMRAYGGIASISQILTTATGQDIAWSTSDGTTEEGELLAENTAASEGDTTFGTAILGAKNSPPKSSVCPMNCCRIAVWILRHFLRHALRPVLDAVRRNTLCLVRGQVRRCSRRGWQHQ